MTRPLFLIVLSFVFLSSVARADTLVIGWQDLVPKAFTGKRMSIPKKAPVLGQPTAEQFGGSEDELKLFLGDIEFMKDMQPQGSRLNASLDGKRVRIPGYVTPVGFDGDNVTEFLLVPFLGACIHVPPPPANQIVYVKNATGLKIEQIWEPVWITGTMKTKSVSTVLADVGYSLTDGKVEPYDDYPENIIQLH